MKRFALHIFTLLLAFAAFAPISANAVVYDPANEETVYQYLIEDMKLSEAAAAGVLANIEHESRFDPTAYYHDVNGNISYGICQWNGTRFEALKTFCAERDLDYTTLEGQLPYLQFELEGEERNAYEKIRNVPDTVEGAYTAGYNWAKYFERCLRFWNGVDQFDSRGILAEEMYWHRVGYEGTVTVSFNANGGYCLRSFKTLPADTAVGTLPTSTREGYVFVGWYTEDGRRASEAVIVSEDMLLTAEWAEQTIAPEEPDTAFLDVTAEDYFYDAVNWAVEQWITTGTGEGLFSPDQTCTRGQVVMFLWRAAGSPMPENTYNRFIDVSEEDYYYNAVLWAVEQGITAGTSSLRFAPAAPCTRAQVAVFLWNAKGRPAVADTANPFGDVQPADYFHDAVLWAVQNWVTGGIGGGLYGSHAPCTRGQIVTFLYRAYAP